MSRHLWGEVKGLDLGPLQKFIDLNLGKGKLSSDAESTLAKILKSQRASIFSCRKAILAVLFRMRAISLLQSQRPLLYC